MAPSKSEARSATSASRPAARVAKPAARAVVCLGGLIALIASILVLVAAPASAVPTAGSRNAATKEVTIKVAPPSSDNAPALQFSFATNNSARCPKGTTRWIYANNSQLTWKLNTNNDPTPTAVTSPNSDQVDCSYTVTISSNLADCSYSIAGISPTTSNTFTLTGSDSPNYSTGAGAFQNLAADSTITVTPTACTAPAANPANRLVLVRNLESNERYRLKFDSFGDCGVTNSPGSIVDRGGVSGGADYFYATLDLRCNWQMSATPIDNITLGGCRVDAILYFSDDTEQLKQGASLFIHAVGAQSNFAGSEGKRLSRVDLLPSTAPAGAGACEELFRLTLQVSLANNLVSQHKDEKISFTLEPLNSREHSRCTQRMTLTASHSTPSATDIVKSPQGVTSTCSYTVTAVSSTTALRLAASQIASRSFNTSGATQTTVRYIYVANRLPVRVSAQIYADAGNVFTTNDRITLIVTSPGACRNDTAFFGGVRADRGVSYGIFVSPGVVGVIGEGSRTVNPAASYDLPPYMNVNGVQTPCVVRVTQASSFEGCTMRNASRDSSGQPYREVAWTATSTAFNLTVEYDCSSETTLGPSARIALPRGWVMLPFNGATGTTAASFRRSLDNAFTSLWVWNTETQAWQGWSTTSSSSLRLNKGDVVFVNVPVARSISYRPDTLLSPAASGGTKAVPTGYSLLAYAGTTSTSLASLFNSQASSIRVIFRWNNASQSWSYFIPGGRPVVTSAEWITTINPGDTVFVLNRSRSAVTIRWP